jgi:hypothetical protein
MVMGLKNARNFSYGQTVSNKEALCQLDLWLAHRGWTFAPIAGQVTQENTDRGNAN